MVKIEEVDDSANPTTQNIKEEEKSRSNPLLDMVNAAKKKTKKRKADQQEKENAPPPPEKSLSEKESEFTANELLTTYGMLPEKWSASKRRFPFNIRLKTLLIPCIIVPVLVGLLGFPFWRTNLWRSSAITFGLSLVAYIATRKMVPSFMEYLKRANLFGKDINKQIAPEKSPSM